MSRHTQFIQRLYEAVGRGDSETMLAGLAVDVEWIEAEGFPYAGTYVGHDAILQGVFARLATEWAPFQVMPQEDFDAGEQLVVLGRYAGTYKATGKSFECDFAHVWRVRDGKVVRFKQYVDSALVVKTLEP